MMSYRTITYKVLSFLTAVCALTACVDDEILIADNNATGSAEGYFTDGYSLNFAVTLDNMGGVTRGSAPEGSLEYWENYIDTEKFRVLFFDNEDKFLFESKSRWVKQLDPGSNGGNRWLVSVPLFTYGNDDVYSEKDSEGKVTENVEWNWKDIRKKLVFDPNDQETFNPESYKSYFKIAILANRPEREWCPGFADVPLATKGWYDNAGPNWTPKHTGQKTVFDLHHCQWDPIYHGKSTEGKDYYDFIMDDYNASDYKNMEPTMGAASSWVDWLGSNKNKWIYRSGNKKAGTATAVSYVNYVRPSATHPIPMYGIQKFARIDPAYWQEGTPFNLSKDITGSENIDIEYERNKKSISLLRSVVKLELFIPRVINGKDVTVDTVAMCYPNIYARCEPMDVWTPTDELWDRQHEGGGNKCKEITSIMNYGTICKSSDDKDNGNTPAQYKQRIGWLYGAWQTKKPGSEKQWWFNDANDGGTAVDFKAYASNNYPRIFNPYIQRSTAVLCENSEVDDDGNYYHYVVYTGERNINDPSDLGNMGDDGGGKPTIQYWAVAINGKYYAFPITDYSVYDNLAFDIETTASPQLSKDDDLTDVLGVDTYVMTLTQSKANSPYMANVMDVNITDPDLLPWPLIRNHVYSLKLASSSLKKKPVILSWDKTHTLSDNVITWKGTVVDENNPSSSDNYTITLEPDNTPSAGSQIFVGTSTNKHTAISIPTGTSNTLTLPDGKVAKKITLYSYVDVAVGEETLVDFSNGKVNVGKLITHGTTTGPTTVDDYTVYQFKNGYTGDNVGRNLEINMSTSNGFKAGDIITIAGFANNSSNQSTVALFTADSYDDTPTTIYTFNNLANLANSEKITEQTYTLEKDYQNLYLGRNGSTAANITLIKITRPISNDVEPTYWSEVTGDDNKNLVTSHEEFHSFRNYTNPDIRKYTFTPYAHEITFTNEGENVCYVIAIDVEDDASATRGADNRNTIDFKVKAEDLHSKSLKVD